MGEPPGGAPRRRFLAALASGAGAVLAAVGALPLLGSLLSPLRRREGEGPGFVAVARLSGLPEGRPVRVTVVAERRDGWWREPAAGLGAAWLVRRGGAVRAFSAACPHLGCLVEIADSGGAAAGTAASGPAWRCPCHGSAFGADGAVSGGPSPRGLDPLEVRISGGEDPVVELRWERFAAGTSARRPV